VAVLTVMRWASWPLLAVVAVAAGCHVAYDGELGTLRCQDMGAYGPPACRDGETCVAGACTAIGAPFGFGCEEDADCVRPAKCLDPAAFGQAGTKRCSLVCCAASDCGAPSQNQVCWHPPGGVGGLCWPADELGRSKPGELRIGDECDSDEQCRSAICDGGSCVDACCGDSYCPADQICRVKVTPVSPQEAFACGLPGSNVDPVICNSHDDCATGKCLPLADGISICAEPCCSSEQCEAKLVADQLIRLACTVVEGSLRTCAKVLPDTAVGGVGSVCAVDEDCRSGLCVDGSAGRYCSDVCCEDASCGDVSAFSCSPAGSGTSWSLQCVRK